MSKVGLIIGREYFTRVKKKSFLITTILVPLLIMAFYAIIIIVAIKGGNSSDSGKLAIIDEAGLCGYRIGGAQIAPWHGNIIINIEHASSADIHSLVEYVETVVKEKTGFILEPEIVFCGR